MCPAHTLSSWNACHKTKALANIALPDNLHAKTPSILDRQIGRLIPGNTGTLIPFCLSSPQLVHVLRNPGRREKTSDRTPFVSLPSICCKPQVQFVIQSFSSDLT